MADISDKKRKYLLFKKDDGRPDHLKPCAFFASADGCKNGSKCRFMHEQPGAAPPTPVFAAPAPAPAPAVTFQAPVYSAPPASFAEETPKKEKKKRRTNDFLEQAAPVPVAVQSIPVAPTPDYAKLMQEKMLLEHQLRTLAAQMTPVAAPAPAPVMALPAPIAPVAPVVKKEKKTHQQPQQPAPVAAAQSTPSSSSGLKAGTLFPTSNIVIGGAPVPMPLLPQNAFPVARAPAPVVIAAAPAPLPAPVSAQESYDSSSDDEDFLFKAVNHALDNGRSEIAKNVSESLKAPKTPRTPKPVTPAPAAPVASSTVDVLSYIGSSSSTAEAFPFVDPSSAVKALETSGTPHATHGKKKTRDIFATPASAKTASAAAPAVPTFDPSAVNFATIDWDALVARTQTHKRFKVDYSFTTDNTWITARTQQQWPGNNAPKVIAIDCEMCETADPVTGVKDKNALIRFSVVNGLDPSQVLIDTLVAPSMPVTDMRTRIHGLTEDQLVPVKYTLRHAQAALYNLITDQTIIIGHSVHNDLKALHFTHSQCIDTAYLYTLDGEGDSMPSLRLVSEQALGFQLVDSHDSVQDACASLYAAVHIGIRGKVPGLKRNGTASTPEKEPNLLLHRLPDYCQEEHIMRVFLAYTNVLPSKIAPLTRGAPNNTEATGKTTVYFTSQAHADLAFDSITGPVRPDKQNKPQKRIYLKGGGYIYVRK